MRDKGLNDAQLETLKARFRERPLEPETLFLETLARTGCRTDEFCRLEVRHIDAKAGTVTIYQGSKGSNSRTFEVDGNLAQRLSKYAENEGMGPNERFATVFSGGNLSAQKRALQRLWERERLNAFGVGFQHGLHAFRHSWARMVYEAAGRDILALQLGLGHKSIASTQHYVTHIKFDQFKGVYKCAFGSEPTTPKRKETK